MEPTCRCHRGRSNSPLPAQQCCPRRAGLPAQCGSSLQRNDAGVWLCEYPGLSFQRSPVCACSLVSSLLLSGATMSQQSSLTQSAHSVRQVLTAYTTDTQMIDSTHVKAHRSAAGGKRGEEKQATGRSRGGRNTKIHALADVKGRLIAILLTGGEAHDCPVADRLVRRVRPSKRILNDTAYDRPSCAKYRSHAARYTGSGKRPRTANSSAQRQHQPRNRGGLHYPWARPGRRPLVRQ